MSSVYSIACNHHFIVNAYLYVHGLLLVHEQTRKLTGT